MGPASPQQRLGQDDGGRVCRPHEPRVRASALPMTGSATAGRESAASAVPACRCADAGYENLRRRTHLDVKFTAHGAGGVFDLVDTRIVVKIE
jgi:hypothetical protein